MAAGDGSKSELAAAFQTGTRFGTYEIGQPLGTGATGAVYQGVRITDGKRVAIKILGRELAAKPTARARFLNEAKLAARLRHPNIVEILDAGEEAESAYLVMELLDGEDLSRRLGRWGAMSVAQAVDILVPVCEAVATAHAAGVIHRDLKPSNIFLTTRDGRLRPMVLDFGVAKDTGTPSDAAGASHLVGTPMYLAPELLADQTKAGPASDQYALGSILYEALTGEHPYAAGDLTQLFRAIAAGKPPSPRARRSDTPVEIDRIVTRAMSADPLARFGTVSDLGRALAPFASAPGETARPGRRRAPSSPAIQAEAVTPSPFVRTLIPEAQAESGPWFFAPPSPDDISNETTIPVALPPRSEAKPAREPERRSSAIDAKTALVSDRFDEPPRLPWNPRRIAVVSAIVVGCLGAVFLIAGRRPVHPTASQATSQLTKVAPTVAVVAPPPAPAPPAATAPAPAAPAPAAVSAVAPAAARPAAAAPPPPEEAPPAAARPAAPRPAAALPTAVTTVSAPVPARRAAAAPASSASLEAPAARPPTSVRHERGPAATIEATESGVEPPRRASPARPRENSDVRMHNGVPLLD